MEEKRIAQEIELQQYLNQLIKDDLESRIEKIKIDDSLSDEAKKDAVAGVEQSCVSYLNLLLIFYDI